MTLEEVLNAYHEVRDECYRLMRDDPFGTLGKDYGFLQYAICESDMSLEFIGNAISCHGWCFSSQTQSNEYFQFDIHENQIQSIRFPI